MKEKNSIIDKIINDAMAVASNIKAVSAAKAKQIMTKSELEVQKLIGSESGALSIRTADILQRKTSVDRLDGKNIISDCRYDLVDSIYKIALEKLIHLPKAEYLELIKSIIIAVAEDGDTLVFSLADKSRISASFVNAIAETKGIELKLSDKSGEFEGGVYMISRGYDKDYSFPALIHRIKEEMNPIVAKALFEVV